MIDKKKIIAIVVFMALSLLVITVAGGREDLLLYVIFTDRFDGSVISEQQVPDGGEAEVPEDPYHKDYVFAGWYLSGEDDVRVTDFTNIKADLKVEARYKTDLNNNGIADEDDSYYNVHFMDSITGQELKNQLVLTGMDAVAPIPLEHEGYNYVGWDREYTNVTGNTTVSTVYESNTVAYSVAESLSVEPEQDPTNPLYCTINFYDRFNNIFDTQSIREGLASSTINNIPSYLGYDLKGWYNGPNGTGNEFIVGSIVTQNQEIYGYWTFTKYEININPNGGTLIDASVKNTLEYGSEFVLPDANKNYDLTLNLNGGTLDNKTDPVTLETQAGLKGYCKNKETCLDTELIAPGTIITVNSSDTYNAIWGSALSELNLPENVTKESSTSTNYEFIGWGTNVNGPVTHGVPGTITLNGNTELVAIYKETVRDYNFAINLNKGSFVDKTFVNPQTLSYGSKITLPALTRQYVLTYNVSSDEVLGGTEKVYYLDASFKGYCKNKETCTTEELIPANTEVTIDGESTYYAIWGPTEDKVSLLGVAKAPSISTKYSLLGWATSADGEVVYILPTSINLTDDLNLYSKYQESPRQYDLTLNLDGGTLTEETTTTGLDYDSSYVLPEATKQHTLTLNPNGGTVNLDDNSNEIKVDASLSGYQKEGETTISKAGTSVTVKSDAIYNAIWGSAIKQIDLPTASKAEDEAGTYTFVGWSEILNGEVTNTVPGTILITKDTELFANYTVVAKQYTITFDANKGTLPVGTPTSSKYNYLTEVVLPNPTRDYVLTYNADGGTLDNNVTSTVTVGASFMGWCEGVKTCETPIKEKVVLTKDVTYYAVWGNSITPVKLASASKTSVSQVFTFNYWRGNSILAYKAGSNLTLTNDTNLKAYYKTTPRKYNVSFVSVFGTIPETQVVAYNGNVTDPGDLSDGDKTFLGWYTSLDGTTKWDFANDNITGDTVLYGIWDVQAYSLTYVLNGGILISNNQGIYETGTEITLPSVNKYYTINYVLNGGTLNDITVNVPISFKGWCLGKETCSDSELLSSATTQTVNTNLVYYAIWETTSNAATLATPTKLSTDTENYTFSNWTDGNNNVYEGGSSLTLTSDITLSANYTSSERKYTVSFVSDYGVNPNGQLVSFGAFVNNPGQLTDETHTFLGWFKDVDRTIPWDFNSDVVSSDTIIYAGWSE